MGGITSAHQSNRIFEIKWHLGVGKPHNLPKMGLFALVKCHWQMEVWMHDSDTSLGHVSYCPNSGRVAKAERRIPKGFLGD